MAAPEIHETAGPRRSADQRDRERRPRSSRRHAEARVATGRPSFAMPGSQTVRLTILGLVFAAIAFFGGSARADVNWLIPLRIICLFAIAVLIVLPIREKAHALRVPAILLAALALVIAVQLIPLPPSIWMELSGHARFAEATQVAGIEQPWRPISLVPWLTWNSLIALLPAFAILMALWGITPMQRDRVIAGFIIFLGLSVLLGVAQVAGAMNGPPLYYRFIAPDSAIGFFANRNHSAAVLSTGFPILRLWSLSAPTGSKSSRRQLLALVGALVLLVMVVVTGSRTGMVVGFMSLAASLLMAPLEELGSRVDPRHARWMQIGAIAAPVVLVLVLVLFGKALSFDRIINDDLMAEQRVVYLPLLIELTRSYLPLGSGFGTFDPVYRSSEPDWAITIQYLNHAHNDLLELAMTGGIAAVGVLGAFVVWILKRLWQTRGMPLHRETVSVRAGTIMAGAIMAASLTDYPLRTPIAGAVMVLASWLIARPLFDMGESRMRKSSHSRGRS